MTGFGNSTLQRFTAGVALAGLISFASPVLATQAQLKQAIATAASDDKVLSAFYKSFKYDTLWTGKDRDDRLRRRALLTALEDAGDHGLPVARYNAKTIETKLRKARKSADRGALDVELSKVYLAYARDLSTGILTPSRLPSPLNKEVARRRLKFDATGALTGISKGNAQKFLARLAPQNPEYGRLMKARMDMLKVASRQSWGPKVPEGKFEPGDSGQAIVALRNRLIRMGYMKRSNSTTFDAKLQAGVQAFQQAHGLTVDGVVGRGTLRMLNVSPETRVAQIIVAMERERWMNFARGQRHVEVNIPDFRAKIIDNGKVTFQTRAVVGRAKKDHRTPEFSDKMEYLVFNPSWYVPKDIATSEYLPMLQEDPFAVSHLDLMDLEGNMVDRLSVDFASLDEDTWPFWLKEPPSQGNALGLVKFMFPNRHNIYLHDTPSKSLFAKESRAFSHGCIRLGDPFGFANEVLSRQSTNPDALIKKALSDKDGEYHLGLRKDIPVHLIYRTARARADGSVEFRHDVYGRDTAIYKALAKVGVTLSGNPG